MTYDSRPDTYEHIQKVQRNLHSIAMTLLCRAEDHDASKLKEPEKEAFDIATPKLKGLTYGSTEYKESTAQLGEALKHHYANNRHHPEHFTRYECNGCFKQYKANKPSVCEVCGYTQFTARSDISQMTLVDLIEMLCDWKAAVERHDDGDIHKSIEINKERYGISDQLSQILENTINNWWHMEANRGAL